MLKIPLHILFILFVVFQGIGQSNSKKVEKIKMIKENDSLMVHFRSYDYIISFNLHDVKQIFSDLNVPFDIQTQDTVIFKNLISSIDSTGKGNLTNNFRLNVRFRDLLDCGAAKIYCISKKQYVRKIERKIENIPAVGRIFLYKKNQKTIFEFAEAHVGCPNF